MNPRSFFGELKRRNVYKVAVAYAVVGWLLVQVATQVFPFFEIPNWAVRLLVLVIIIGFPIALIIGWAFELTPEGLKRTEAADREPARPSRNKVWIYVVIIAGAISVGLVFLGRYTAPDKQSGLGDAGLKSIAVLRFENLSEDKANAFFADGIQDEILTRLAKIADLKVISRISTQRYTTSPDDLPKIAKQLGVAHVLEGSVQKAGDRVRVNVQLIRAATDSHLWAETYDRNLTDIFAVESEIAESIAKSLKAKLSSREQQAVTAKPTDNAQAYTLYLKALELEAAPDITPAIYKSIEELYAKAVELDPKFALAHAKLSSAIGATYHEFEPTEERSKRARAEAEEALRLDPDLGEGHAALARWYYWVAGDYETALKELAIAKKAMPNNAEVVLTTAAIRRRQGRWREALAQFERAQVLDPLNGLVLQETTFTYFMLRDWASARVSADRVLAVAPSSPTAYMFQASVEIFERGDLTAAEKIINGIPPSADSNNSRALMPWEIAMFRRDWDRAAQILSEIKQERFFVPSGPPVPKKYLEGCIAVARGDPHRGHAAFDEAIAEFEKYVQESPNDASRHASLGLACAFAGRKEEAIREGRRALELTPESKDALLGAQFAANMAVIYAQTGETERALDLVERLITTPAAVGFGDASVTLQDLRLRWAWDPLRKEPRFQKLVKGAEPKTVY